MKIFQPITLSETEQDIIANWLADPTIQKYLKSLAVDIGASIVMSAPSTGQSLEEFLRRRAQAQGQLLMLDILVQAGAQIDGLISTSHQS